MLTFSNFYIFSFFFLNCTRLWPSDLLTYLISLAGLQQTSFASHWTSINDIYVNVLSEYNSCLAFFSSLLSIKNYSPIRCSKQKSVAKIFLIKSFKTLLSFISHDLKFFLLFQLSEHSNCSFLTMLCRILLCSIYSFVSLEEENK